MTTTKKAKAARVLDPVLAAVRTRRSTRDDAEVELLKSVLDWAVEHTVDPADADSVAATYIESFGETGLTLAGPGAPCVSEFDTYELAAALGNVLGVRQALRRPGTRAQVPAAADLCPDRGR